MYPDYPNLEPMTVERVTFTPPSSAHGSEIYSFRVVRLDPSGWDITPDAYMLEEIGEILPRIVFGENIGGVGVGLSSLPPTRSGVDIAILLLNRSLSVLQSLGWEKTEVVMVGVDYTDPSEPVVRIEEVRK